MIETNTTSWGDIARTNTPVRCQRSPSPNPQPIQRRRTKGFRSPPNTASVCRPGLWGNPFSTAWAIDQGHATPENAQAFVVEAYADWLEHGPASSWDKELITYGGRTLREHHALVISRLEELRGKNLSCFCALDRPCHRQPLLRRANTL